eukprot:2868946-Lingulodinium_polyedra.AAC.1
MDPPEPVMFIAVLDFLVDTDVGAANRKAWRLRCKSTTARAGLEALEAHVGICKLERFKGKNQEGEIKL